MPIGLRERTKYYALALSDKFGINAALRFRFSSRLLSLAYHGVVSADHAGDPYQYLYRNTVSVRELRAHLEILGRHFRPVSLTDVADWIEDRRSLPKRSVLLTFDDGYRNNLTLAAPILRQYGFPALISITTDFIGKRSLLWTEEVTLRVVYWPKDKIPQPDGGEAACLRADPASRLALAHRIRNRCKQLSDEQRIAYLDRLRQAPLTVDDHEERTAFLSWDEVRALAQQGFDIGAHTVTHPILTRVAPSALARELTGSKAAVEQMLGRPCPAVVYPNGGIHDVSDAVFAAAAAAGYRVGFTLTGKPSPVRPNPMAIPRTNITGHLPSTVFKGIISHLLG